MFKTADGWRALKPTWSMRSGKPLLTQRCLYKGAEIETPGGRWEIEWLENGKRKRLKCTDHADVLKQKARQELKLSAQAAGIAVVEKPAAGKRLLKDATAEYLAEIKVTKAHKTWQAMKQVLDTFTAVVGRKHLEDVTRADCLTKFGTHLQESGLSDRTVYHRLACLLTFLKWANHRVFAMKEIPAYEEQEIHCYSQSDLDALFAACDADERFLFEFFLFTGCREGEVAHAEWEDLKRVKDEEGKEITVLHIHEKPQWGWRTKGRKARFVRIPEWLEEELETRRGTGLIFPNEETKRPEGHLLRKLKAVAKRASLKGAWTLHCFRHTFATMHLQSGVDPRTVQKWMGHKDLNTTMQYLDWLDIHGKEAGLAANKTFRV